jgi:hypothetical protein
MKTFIHPAPAPAATAAAWNVPCQEATSVALGRGDVRALDRRCAG